MRKPKRKQATKADIWVAAISMFLKLNKLVLLETPSDWHPTLLAAIERALAHQYALETACQVAGISPEERKKMLDFCHKRIVQWHKDKLGEA